jgi:energy-coupling factor transporter ATP-binding protein EcfA2
MPITPPEDEPVAGPWRVIPLSELVSVLLNAGVRLVGRPRIVAVDGRSGSGKTTLAERLRTAVPDAEVVHTDDIAWWHSRFGWYDLIIDGVLEPLHRGQLVHYQRPAWASHGRGGHIDVSAKASLVIIEGVGAARRELTALLDAAVWVQSDFGEAERRAALRHGGDAAAMEQTRDWMIQELPFLAADRPWERTTIIVAGTSDITHDSVGEVVIAHGSMNNARGSTERQQ